MARTTKNKYYRKGGDKYSVEHKCAQMDMVAAPGQSYVQIVPDTGVEGMRKVKHITISAAANVVNVGALYWALVYVPQGYAPNNLNLTGGASMYEPNQNVMASIGIQVSITNANANAKSVFRKYGIFKSP